MSQSEQPPTIVVLGGINMDLIGVTPRLPLPGETVIGDRFYTAPGGKGANQAVAAARLGARVRMVGRVGKDSFGPTLLNDLRAYGVDTEGVAEDPDNPSGVAIILLDSRRQNHIVAAYGANAACDGAQLDAVKRALQGADALLLQLEVPFEISLLAAQYARSMGVTVVWDPAPARDLPDEVYDSVDLLTPNQVEAMSLTGVEVTDVGSAGAAADLLLGRGVPAVVVKLGEDGAYYASVDGRGHVPAYGVEAVDTVAAGDAFGAALAVALSEGRGLRDAVRVGAAAGALAVTRPGAQEAMPPRGEVEELVSRS
ncbi:MAG: ribokinase [Chloroflexi bacterium]|nr:ribokinase [Chloroflexota bacterium]